MPLALGTRLGPYEILAVAGAGGMGEVYRARDTRLDRIVAIKTSAEQFSKRFHREARAIAALNHPNICSLYDVGTDYLVMEFVEGPTLAERIRGGRISPDEAVPIARQIAEALEAAHDKGIIHRDLKPTNVKLTAGGNAKVLDFGLAKAVEDTEAADSANSPTLAIGMAATRAGVILGTAGYMSPEQARGRAVDKRADIWSFGVVLLEMLSGGAAYPGETVAETLASVIRDDPPLNLLPDDTPPAVRRLLVRCLDKDAKQRLRDIGEARIVLEKPEAVWTAQPAVEPIAASPLRRSWLPWTLAALLACAFAIAAWFAYRHMIETQPVASLSLLPPEQAAFAERSVPVLSPDGRKLAFIGSSGSERRLWIRMLDSTAARALPGTDEANLPFWSPDSMAVGFFAQQKLKRVMIEGGPVQTLCDAPGGRGGSWSPRGIIVFSPTMASPLFRVDATGGQPAAVTAIDPSRHEISHRFPDFLPDGRHFLFVARGAAGSEQTINAGDLDSSERSHLSLTESQAQFALPGFVLFVRQHSLMALAFDANRLSARGRPFPLIQPAGIDGRTGLGGFSVSQSGVLAYFAESASNTQLKWFDANGMEAGAVGQVGSPVKPQLSPDGETVMIDPVDPSLNRRSIWLLRGGRGADTRVTFGETDSFQPIWSPDGHKVAFGASGSESAGSSLIIKSADGAGSSETIVSAKTSILPSDWSARAGLLVYSQVRDMGSSTDLWTVPLSGSRKPVLYRERSGYGHLSPDARWMLYGSADTGTWQVYVQSFPTPGGQIRVSTDGGYSAIWSRDGKRIYYIGLDQKMMVADVNTGSHLEAGPPRALFQTHIGMFGIFSVSADGKHFLIPTEIWGRSPLTVVLNWPATLKKLTSR